MADVTADQISQARAAGYSDDEIVSHLASKAPEKFKAAKDAGYSASEILSHFGAAKTAPKPTTAPDAASEEPSIISDITSGARHGYNEMVRGVQSSRKNILGSDVDDSPVDPDYKPANVTNGSWNPLKWSPRQIPKLIAEQAPLAATSAAGAAVGDLLTPAGAVVGGLAPLVLSQAGDNVKARAVARSGDKNAVPNDEDKAIGIGTSLAAAVPGSIMHAPGLGNAVGAGLNGLGRVATNLLTRGAVGAGGGVAQNAITQAGTKIGTDVPFDPSALPEAAVGGAASVSPHVLPAVAAGARAIRMGKYNADPEAAANYATRLQDTGLDLNNIHEAAQAHQKVMADTHGELKAALDNVAKQKVLTPEEANAIASIRRGDQITPKDMEHLTTATANAPDGANAHFLARALKTGQQAEGEGSFDPKTGWQGSATGGMKSVVRGVFNPWHIGGTMAGLGALAFGMPHVSGAVGGGLMGGLGIGLGGARLLDSVTGGSRPAANFAKTFADHNAELRKATNPPPVPQQPPPLPQPTNAPWGPRPPAAGPTGPQVPPPAAPPPAAPQFNPMALQMLKKQLATPLPGAPAPPAPPAPQVPEFNPMALQMLKQKLKAGLPPDPQPEPTPPPAPPAKPDISPMALAMLQKKLKAGLPAPEAPPAEAPPAAPAAPEFNPTALAMLKQKLKQGLPPAPVPGQSDSAPTTQMTDGSVAAKQAIPATAMKISKSNGKVKTEAPKAEETKAAFAPLDEERLYPADISPQAYAIREAAAYGVRSPKYRDQAEQSAQNRINSETALVAKYPEFTHAIKGLVRQLHKIGTNPKRRDAAVDHYAAFLPPEVASAVQSAFK
jgi:hypothetical protein